MEFFPIFPDYSWSNSVAKLRSYRRPVRSSYVSYNVYNFLLPEKGFLFLKLLSETGSQIHLFLSGTGTVSKA